MHKLISESGFLEFDDLKGKKVFGDGRLRNTENMAGVKTATAEDRRT